MADFSPQIMQGSSLRGESFIRQPVEAIDGQALKNAADAASGIYQNVQFNKKNKEAAEVQKQFLDDYQTGVDIKNLQDELGSTPQEDAAYSKISGQIQTLQDSLKGRRIDPAEAMSRIEDLKRQALNHAPSYAAKIRNLGGASSVSFDTVTEQLISEENKFRQDIKDRGLDPDIESHRAIVRKELNDAAELRMEQNNQALTPFRKAEHISRMINNRIATIDAVINKQIDAAGGNVLNMSNEDRNGIVTWLTGMSGNESFIVKQMIDESNSVAYEDIPEKTISKMEQQVKGAVDAKIAQLNGSVPKLLSQNELDYQNNEVMLRIQRDDPILFTYLGILSKTPPQSVAAINIANMAGDRMVKYMTDKSQGHYQDTTLQALRAAGEDNPEAIHRQYAKNLKDVRTFIEQNADKVDPRFVQHHTRNLVGDMQAVMDHPRGFLPEQMDEMINHIASPQFDQIIARQDQNLYNEFKQKSAQFLETYATENMAPDINRELDKEVSTDSFGGFISGIVGKRGTLRDLLSITINPQTGTLQFLPNTGLKSISDERKAEREARRLTQMYSARSQSIVDAGYKIVKGSPGTSEQTPATISSNLFREVLGTIGEPLRDGPEQVKPRKTAAEQAGEDIQASLEAKQGQPRMPGPFGF